MRVAVFFVAFGFLFAFVIPQMLSTFLTEDKDQVTWQLMQGADPTELLEETASGVSAPQCGLEGYHYLLTEKGAPYVKSDKSQYIVALIDDKPVFYKLRESGQVAEKHKGTLDEVVNGQELETLLLDCTQGDAKPSRSTLSLLE
ncbi:MAG: hypothetical protein OQL20_00300 [Sedimenticola sp.]|nr:hypothetical protein [Sedimenticola sp.]